MPPIETRIGDSRREPWALWILIAVLLLLRIVATAWEQHHPPASRDLVHWVPFAHAVTMSQRTGKPILYDFTADWCQPCQTLQREVFCSARWANRVDGEFVPVRILDRTREDGSNASAVDSLRSVFAVVAFPTLVIYSPTSGRHFTRAGFGEADSTTNWLMMTAMRERISQMLPPPSIRP